jgi:fibronectin type 3 domain-containing protein
VKKPSQGPLAPPPEPLRQILLVEPHAQDPDHALDTSIRFGEAYEYRAQRVARVAVNGQTLELAGPFSAPLRVDAVNQFPPTVPGGLAAVATAGENGNPPAIDLSWLPDTETDLAGYIVYRREPGATPDSNAGKWQRILPAQPVVGPGFHDVGVQPGHTYSYAVTAIDQDGHESARSAEAQETVPTP